MGMAVHLLKWMLLVCFLLACGCPVEAPSAAPPHSPPGTTRPVAAMPPAWPALPADDAAAQKLIKRLTRLAPPRHERPALTAAGVLELLRTRIRQGRAIAGWPAIVRWFQGQLDRGARARTGVRLLWGVYHDSGGQVRAFRRLIGPGGLRGLHAVTVELLSADGQWLGLPRAAQQGDSADLRDYLTRGSAAAWQRLAARQRQHNYTAWKYDYLPRVMDLPVAARAGGRRLLGCDMPPALKRRIRGLTMANRLRLRELHCGLATTRALRALPGPRRVAALWGQQHLAADGVPRFLPRSTRLLAVLVLGHRPGPHGLEQPLSRVLALSHPMLLSLDDPGPRQTMLLLLPGPVLGATVERTRDHPERPLAPARHGQLTLRARARGRWMAHHDAVTLAGNDAPATLKLPPGSHAFLYAGGGKLLAGAVQIPPSSMVDLNLDAARRTVHYALVEHKTRSKAPNK